MPNLPNPPTSTSSFAPQRPWPWLMAVVLAVGAFSALAPRYEAAGVLVTPLAAALVVALGAAALMGWRALPAVAVGAALGAFGWPLTWPDASESVGAFTLVVQAAFGGLLVRHSGRPDDLALDTRPAIRRLLAAAVACGLIGGLLRMVGELAWSSDPTLRPGTLLLVRAVADAASVVIGLPVLLAFTAPQRSRWLPRRRMVALPLIGLMAVMLVAFMLINERDRQQAQSRFERDAEVVFARTRALLDVPMQMLLALNGAFQAAPSALTVPDFDRMVQPWAKRALGMGSVGWIEMPTPPAAAASGAAPAAAAPAVADSQDLKHVLGSLPMLASAASAPARSLLDLPAMRQTAQRAARQEDAAASPPVSLGSGPDARPGFVVMQGLSNTDLPGRRSLAFATVAADALIAPVLASRADAMRGCLFETDARTEYRRLAGPSGCESAVASDNLFVREAAFDYGGRRWAMRVSQPVRTTGSVWLFALPALAGGALLSMLLVGITGQVMRVRNEARSRTDELRHEVDLHARAEAAHERTVNAMLDTVQIGMAVIDPDGRINRVNSVFAAMAGATPEALRHRAVDDVLVDAERPSSNRILRLIQDASDELVHQSLRLRNADGQVTPSLVTLRVLRDEAGRATSAVCAVHDLSENLRRRQVETVLGNVLDLSRGGEASAGSSPPAREALKAAPARHRMLVVAGDPALPDELRGVLHDRPNVDLLGARGGPEGLVLARTHSPHLVLLDLDLPDADSLALMRTLSAEGFAVIALSRDLRPARIDEAFAAGARGYLTLPLEARELLAVMDDLI